MGVQIKHVDNTLTLVWWCTIYFLLELCMEPGCSRYSD